MSEQKASPQRIIKIRPELLLLLLSGENHYRADLPAETRIVKVFYDWKSGLVMAVVEGPGILEATLGEPLVRDYGLPELEVRITMLPKPQQAESKG